MPSSRDFIAALRVLLHGLDRGVAWRLGTTVLLVIATGLLAGLAPLALRGMIDAATGPLGQRDRTASAPTITFGAVYLVLLCGGRLLAELRPALIGVAEQRLYARLRRRFFGHLLGLPLAFHLGRRTGALVHGLQQAISGYQVIVFHLVNSVVPVLVELATVTIVLLALGQPALMASFAGTALAYLAVLGLRKSELTNAAHGVSDASSDVQGTLTDGLLNCETIKCFGAEQSARDRFAKSTEVLEEHWAGLQQHRLRMGFTVTTIFAISMAASLAIAVHAAMHGTLTVGGFVLANIYMLQIMRPLEMLGAASRDVFQAIEWVRPLIDVLQELPETARPTERPTHGVDGAPPNGHSVSPVTKRRTAPAISFRGVHLAYDAGKPALRDLSFDIAAGQTVAIVGGSGSGKSSLLRLLLRLYEPQSGSILLDDVAIDTLRLDELRHMVAVVPQDTVLFNDTIAANIRIGKAGATPCEISRAARLARVHEFISALPAGYDTVVGERGLKLSGGERQRIAIARAVLKDPQVYVFDEATSMLDGLTEMAILRNLRETSAGRTTVTIAHRLSSVQHADEIVVLDGGMLAEHGDHATLLARNGAYAAMWRAQQGGGLA